MTIEKMQALLQGPVEEFKHTHLHRDTQRYRLYTRRNSAAEATPLDIFYSDRFDFQTNYVLGKCIHMWMSASGQAMGEINLPYFSFKSFYLFIWLHWVLVIARGILSCSTWDLGPWSGIEPGPPALGAQSPRHWTTREIPNLPYFILINVVWVDGATGTNSFHHSPASLHVGHPLHTQDISKYS